MTLAEFVRRAKVASEKELVELFKQYPELGQQCADQIEADLKDHTAGRAVTYDGADYQRLIDRGEEEIEEYNYTEDI